MDKEFPIEFRKSQLTPTSEPYLKEDAWDNQDMYMRMHHIIGIRQDYFGLDFNPVIRVSRTQIKKQLVQVDREIKRVIDGLDNFRREHLYKSR